MTIELLPYFELYIRKGKNSKSKIWFSIPEPDIQTVLSSFLLFHSQRFESN